MFFFFWHKDMTIETPLSRYCLIELFSFYLFYYNCITINAQANFKVVQENTNCWILPTSSPRTQNSISWYCPELLTLRNLRTFSMGGDDTTSVPLFIVLCRYSHTFLWSFTGKKKSNTLFNMMTLASLILSLYFLISPWRTDTRFYNNETVYKS